MLRPRWKKVLHDLIQNRSRTAFVVLSVAVGVFAVTVILGARGILLREFNANLTSSNPAAVTFRTTGFDEYQANAVGRVDGVEAVEPRTQQVDRYTLEENPDVDKVEWKQIFIEVLDDFDKQNVNRITPVTVENWPPGRDEIVIEQSALEVVDLSIGDTITVECSSGGALRELRVVGIVHDINAMPAQFGETPITGYVSPESVFDLALPEVYTTMMITSDVANPTRADYEKLAEKAKETLEQNNVRIVSTTITNPGSHFMGDIFKAVALLLLVMGVLSLFLSGFLVVNTINALMSNHVKQIGIMKAVGGKAGQVAAMYVVMMVILSIFALIIGLPMAQWIGGYLIDYAVTKLNFRVESMIPPTYTLVISVIVGLLVPLIASLGPIMRGAKTPIVKAFNPAAAEVEKGFGHSWSDRILGKIRGLPRPVALSLRNTFQRKGRLATTLITLLLACAMIMAVLTVRNGVDVTVADFADRWTYDIMMSFSGPQPADRVAALAEKYKEITRTETWMTTTTTYLRADGSRDESVITASLPVDTDYYHPDIQAGRWLSETPVRDEVVVSTIFLKDNPGAALGRDITLKVYGEEHMFRIVGVVPGFADDAEVYLSEDVWQKWTGHTDDAKTIYITAPGLTEDARVKLSDDLEAEFNDDGHNVQNTAVMTVLQKSFSSQMDILVMFLFIMAGVLGAVGVIGLSGTMMINVIDSTREIGVMRAIGASHRSIYTIFITEGLVVALMAWVAGTFVSWPLSYLLNDALGQAIGFPLVYNFSFTGVALTFVLVLLISVAASLLPSWRASQISVRDAISYE